MLRFLNDNYYLLSVLVILLVILLAGVYYSRRLSTKEIVLIAVLSSLSAISRGVFYWAPQFKPLSAMVLVSASILGPVPGMLIGVLSGFLSNFFFGQGPWSPFQMLAWGIIGFIGGFADTNNKWIASLVGFTTVFFIYGPILNLASMVMMCSEYSWTSFWLMELSGIPFDLIHAGATVIFIYFIWLPMRKKLVRLRDKYNMLKK